jgi:hydroxymethylglutaryl-CoA synthase
MKSSTSVSISGYGGYVPKLRLPTSEVAKLWKGGGSGPNKAKSVANIDEDTTTMSVEAARDAILMAGDCNIGAVFVGTESKPYAVKPTSTIVAQALGINRTLAADFEFACKAGTEAMQVITGLIGSSMIDSGLALGVDTAQGRPGDSLEYTAGSAAAAFVLSKRSENSIATIEASTSYITDTGDFWRRQGESFPKHLSRFTGDPGYFHHVESSVNILLKEINAQPEDFKYAVFHQPNPKFPVEVARRLGFTRDQIDTGLLNPEIGNPYSASSPLGLVAILDVAMPGDKILLASFGSGAGSDAFSLIVDDNIVEKRKNSTPLREKLNDNVEINYGTYAKIRGILDR